MGFTQSFSVDRRSIKYAVEIPTWTIAAGVGAVAVMGVAGYYLLTKG